MCERVRRSVVIGDDWGVKGVHPDCRIPPPGEFPRATKVIDMGVRQEETPDVGRCKRFAEPRPHKVEPVENLRRTVAFATPRIDQRRDVVAENEMDVPDQVRQDSRRNPVNPLR